mgnify:CR=1 FL=1
MTVDRLFRARRAIVGDVETSAAVGVAGGRIAIVAPFEAPIEAGEVIELDHDEVLLPGLVDTHVHVNEPGRTEWEGFDTATRAAAAGGVTTIVDMPLNSIPPTTNLAALDAKRERARGQAHVDVGFWGGAVPDNLSDLRPLHEAGRVRLQVLSRRLGRFRVPAAGRAPDSPPRWPKPPGRVPC